MAEETVWRGSVSQWKNFGFFILQVLFAAAIVVLFMMIRQQSSSEIRNFAPYILILLAMPIFIAGKRYLQTKCKIYELTSERVKTTEGVFSKVTDTLELYRVRTLRLGNRLFIASAALKASSSTPRIRLHRLS